MRKQLVAGRLEASGLSITALLIKVEVDNIDLSCLEQDQTSPGESLRHLCLGPSMKPAELILQPHVRKRSME